MRDREAQTDDRATAARLLGRVEARFGREWRRLAAFAAVPFILTPELVHYLRCRFLPGVPWIAEADLLLSDLCETVGHEQYALLPAARAVLLSELQEREGEARLAETAGLLLHYLEEIRRLAPQRLWRELETQQWGAMVYLDDERRTAAAEGIAEGVRSAIEAIARSGASRSALAELERLHEITHRLEPQLARFPELLENARILGRLIDDPYRFNADSLRRLLEQESRVVQIGRALLPNLKSLEADPTSDGDPAIAPSSTIWALIAAANETEQKSVQNTLERAGIPSERLFTATGGARLLHDTDLIGSLSQ